MEMNKHKYFILSKSILACLMVGLSFHVHADSRVRNLSYSPDHWPTRWSSAIRQQQSSKFPTRQKDQAAPPALPETVSEQDLFSSPPQGSRHDCCARRYGFNQRFSHQNYLHNARGNVRDAAYAYQIRFQVSPYSGMGQLYMPTPYASSMMVMDPVLGHPGIGMPMMPGVPAGYLFGGVSYGFPGNTGMWNPVYGRW